MAAGDYRHGGDSYGLHRVVSPHGVLPQAAEKLDASLPIYDNELLIRVERLNIDAASFALLKQETKGDAKALAAWVLSLVNRHGKLHNPITHSGGCLLGQVEQVGPEFPRGKFTVDHRIATLVSLTLTPLHLDEVVSVDMNSHQLQVSGHAILFASGIAAVLPDDLPETIALSVLDVCGAPATVPRVVQPGNIVVVLGAGKAGVLTMAAAKEIVGADGMIIAVDQSAAAIGALQPCSFVDEGIVIDATNPIAVPQKIKEVTGKMADVVFNCASAPHTEIASVLACRPGGTVVFFNMTTNFQATVLGAEGLAHDVKLLMGSGYVPGHAEFACDLLRRSPPLRSWFASKV